MTKYIVYCHTLNNKKYIGYTKKTMSERLEDHIKDAQTGSDRHFHRAIRKYGVENIVSDQLCEVETREQAKLKECLYVEQYDTFKNGYNMTQGGDGGNTKEKYSKKQLHNWGKNRSKLSSGMNNGNAKPDITKETIIKVLCDFIKETNKFRQYVFRKELESVLKDRLSVSNMTLRNRGISNHTELVQLINNELGPDNCVKYNPYYRSSEHKKHLSSQSAKWIWVTDGTVNCRIELSIMDNFLEENKDYYRGRTLKNENS